jgi:peptidoglycan-associated lipoprotein
MSPKLVITVAALFFVAACTTAPEEAADSGGAGGSTSTSRTTVTTDSGSSGGGSSAGQSASRSSDDQVRPGSQADQAGSQADQAGSQADLVANVGDRIFFGFDKFDLSSDAQRTLRLQAEWLISNSGLSVRVEGHCDERGTREYNLALGERRANSIKNFLVELGVAPSRITTISFGKERPVALGSNDAAWAQNRRGVTLVN